MDLERIAVIEAIPHKSRRMDDGVLYTEPIDVRNFRSVEVRLEIGNVEVLEVETDAAAAPGQMPDGDNDLPPAEPPSRAELEAEARAARLAELVNAEFQWEVKENFGDGFQWMEYGDVVYGADLDEGEYIRLAVFVALPLMRLKITRINSKVGFRSAQYILGGAHSLPHDTGIPLTVVPHNHGHPLYVGLDSGDEWGTFVGPRA